MNMADGTDESPAGNLETEWVDWKSALDVGYVHASLQRQ
jgi:hypothetical protein